MANCQKPYVVITGTALPLLLSWGKPHISHVVLAEPRWSYSVLRYKTEHAASSWPPDLTQCSVQKGRLLPETMTSDFPGNRKLVEVTLYLFYWRKPDSYIILWASQAWVYSSKDLSRESYTMKTWVYANYQSLLRLRCVSYKKTGGTGETVCSGILAEVLLWQTQMYRPKVHICSPGYGNRPRTC